MQVKVYIPKIIEISSELLPALAHRAVNHLGKAANKMSATRGHLIRQAVQDGLLPDMNDLVGQDGTVDLVCDHANENGGKPWHYLLIPHDQIQDQMTLAGLAARCEVQARS